MYGADLKLANPWINNFEKRLQGMLRDITSKFSGNCEIFLLNIYDPTDGVGDIENAHILLPKWEDGLQILKKYNDIIAKVASKNKNVHLVDIHKAFLGHGVHC
jgi:hypothetical protein